MCVGIDMNRLHSCILLIEVASLLMPLITSFAPPSLMIGPLHTSKSTSRIRRCSLLQAHGTNLIHTNDIANRHFNDTICNSKDDESSQLLNGFTTIENTHEATIHTNNVPTGELPRHIAFICDGNSRWSKRQSLPKSMGHAAGADRVINVIKALQRYQPDDFDYPESSSSLSQSITEHTNTETTSTTQLHRKGIEYCTLYAFSTENWARSPEEINTIFKLMERIAIQYRSHESVQSGKIQIDLLGNLEDERIPPSAKRELQRLQSESRDACDKRREKFGNSANILTICLAINYGARADILQAAQKLAQAIASGELTPNDVAVMGESEISKRLCTAHIPDPDLIIRTSGETRLSNFLLWDAAYAELYFTDLLWPDFDEEALEEALVWYGKRKRRFGGRNE